MNEEAKQKQQPLQEEYIYYITNSLSLSPASTLHTLFYSPPSSPLGRTQSS